jgi:tape measure domain-containing protein
VAALVGVGAATFQLASGAIDTATKLGTIEQRFKAMGGSAAYSTTQLDHLHEESLRLGVDFLTLADGFSRFAVAANNSGLTSGQVTKAFDTFAALGSKLHASKDEMESVFLAVQQMLSKGKVSAEELQRQLGNALPIPVFRLAAEAMGKTQEQFNKMLRTGSIMSTDFLPKFVEVLRTTYNITDTTRVDSMNAAYGRLSTTTTDLYHSFDQAFGISKSYMGSLNLLSQSFELLAKNMDVVKQAVIAVGIGFAAAFAPAALAGIGAVVTALADLPALLASIGAAWETLTVLMSSTPWGAIALGITAAAVAFLAMRANSDEAEKQVKETIKTTQAYIDSLKGVHEEQEKSAQSTKTQVDKQRDAISTLNDLIAKDKERLETLQHIKDAQEGKNGDIAAAMGANEGVASWQGVDAQMKTANETLQKHLSDLARAKSQVQELTDLWEREKNAQELAGGAFTDNEITAQQKAFRMLADANQLADASKRGAEAMQKAREQIAARDDILSYGKLIDKSGLAEKDPQLAQGLKDDYAAAIKLATQHLTVQTALNKVLLEANDIENQSRAVMDDLGNAYKKLPTDELRDKLRQITDEMTRQHYGMAQIKVATDAYTKAFVDLQIAQREAASVNAGKELFEMSLKIQALSSDAYTGAASLQQLDHQLQNDAAVKQRRDALIAAGVTFEEATQKANAFRDALESLDQAAGENALKKLADETAHYNQMISAVRGGAGKPELDEIERLYQKQEATRSLMEQMIAAGAVQAETNRLIKEGIDPLIAQKQAIDNVTAAVQAQTNAQYDWSQLQPKIKDTESLWKQFAKTIQDSAGQVADSLASMLDGTASKSQNLLQVVQNMLHQLLAEALKMQVIKPIFDALLSPITGTNGLGPKGQTGSESGAGGLFSLFGGGGGGGGSSGGIFSFLGSLFGGGGGAADAVSMSSGGTGAMGMFDVASSSAGAAASSGGFFSFLADIGSMFAFLAKGGAFSGGVQFAAKGMVLPGATMFSGPSGPIIGGELGRDSEALLPLTRDGGGRLGVKAMVESNNDNYRQMTSNARYANMPPMVMNVYAKDAPSFGYSENQIASRMDLIQKRAAQRLR